jgi:SAM-dependent methyltransferase
MNVTAVRQTPGGFLRRPEAYDLHIRRFVRCYGEMLESLFESLALMDRDQADVLEVGCRTGHLAGLLLRAKPEARLTAIDGDMDMVLACKESLGLRAEEIELLCRPEARFSRPRSFDYILSHLALHRLEGTLEMKSFCGNAFESLRPGGILACSLMIEGDTHETSDIMWSCWERDVRNGGVSAAELDQWRAEDLRDCHPVTSRLWLGWMKEAGFVHADIVWGETIFATIWAKKPLSSI